MNKEKVEAPIATFENLPRGLQALWKERLFNAEKLCMTLLNADSVLTWAFLQWLMLVFVVTGFYSWSPQRFPLQVELAWSLAAFFSYYALIGFVRRQAQKYSVTLRAEYPDSTTDDGAKIVSEKVYREEDDPPIARAGFSLRDTFHLPRRGLGQAAVVLSQFVFCLFYAVNFTRWVVLEVRPDAANFPILLWVFHLVVTVGGFLILLKNAGFIVDMKKLLTIAEGVLSFAGKIPFRGSRKQ